MELLRALLNVLIIVTIVTAMIGFGVSCFSAYAKAAAGNLAASRYLFIVLLLVDALFVDGVIEATSKHEYFRAVGRLSSLLMFGWATVKEWRRMQSLQGERKSALHG